MVFLVFGFVSLSPFPVFVPLRQVVCVAGGVAGFLVEADEAHRLSLTQIIPSIKAWS